MEGKNAKLYVDSTSVQKSKIPTHKSKTSGICAELQDSKRKRKKLKRLKKNEFI